jgi:hypothetical protein
LIGIPKTYLGAEVGEYRLPDQPDKIRWSLGSGKYIREAIRNVKTWLDKRGKFLKTKASSVLPTGYRLELDATPYCTDKESSYYQQQIGVLRWVVELGRIDICSEVSMLAAFTAAPRTGHFAGILHMFAYLNKHSWSRLVFDNSYDRIYNEVEANRTGFYPDAREDVPADMPEPRGKEVQIIAFIDADHAGDLLTRRSRTSVLIYLNRSPIVWYSKKQNTVETSCFGSEFTALHTGIEISKGLRFKLSMMGVPLAGHAHIRVDNNSVVLNQGCLVRSFVI